MKQEEIMKKLWKNNRGFTLIEVVAVLIILAIVSAVAISRGIDTDAVKAQAEVDTLKGHLRYAQYLAMNDVPPFKWGINVGGSSYTLVRLDTNTNGTTNPYNLPGDSSATHNLASGISATVTGNNPILFDEWGSPGTASTSISVGGLSITLTPETGYIP